MPVIIAPLSLAVSLLTTPIPTITNNQYKQKCYTVYWMKDNSSMAVAPHVIEMYPETIEQVTTELYCPDSKKGS